MVIKTLIKAADATPADARPDDNDLLTEAEASKELGDVAPGTLTVWRSTGRYKLPFIKIGRLVRYRRGDLRDWKKSRTRETGATA